MKLLPFMAAMVLVLPMSAEATVAMEAQQASGSGEIIQPPSAVPGAHRPLFIVKYVLRSASSETPPIVMDDADPSIVPPGKDFPTATLGALDRDPNVDICYGWGCERKP